MACGLFKVVAVSLLRLIHVGYSAGLSGIVPGSIRDPPRINCYLQQAFRKWRNTIAANNASARIVTLLAARFMALPWTLRGAHAADRVERCKLGTRSSRLYVVSQRSEVTSQSRTEVDEDPARGVA